MNPFRNGNGDNGFDLDAFLAYDTVQVVRVLDRRAGIMFRVFQLVICAYVIYYVCFISKKYLAEETVQGAVAVTMSKPQFSDMGIPWDIYDRSTQGGEQGAIFIPTRVLITRGQTQNDEYCESPLHPCKSNEDCNIRNDKLQKPECVNGHCMRRQWCPAEDPKAGVTETVYLEFDKVELRFSSYTHFHSFQMYVATSDESEPVLYPAENANTYLLKDLVKWTDTDPTEIMENGAVMEVDLMLDSPLTTGERYVKQTVESHNIDIVTGYNFVQNQYYYDGETRKRDTYRMFGVRLLAFTTGFAERISASGIVLQFSSAWALMGVAELLTDWFLIYGVAERMHYDKYRTKLTEDFNEN